MFNFRKVLLSPKAVCLSVLLSAGVAPAFAHGGHGGGGGHSCGHSSFSHSSFSHSSFSHGSSMHSFSHSSFSHSSFPHTSFSHSSFHSTFEPSFGSHASITPVAGGMSNLSTHMNANAGSLEPAMHASSVPAGWGARSMATGFNGSGATSQHVGLFGHLHRMFCHTNGMQSALSQAPAMQMMAQSAGHTISPLSPSMHLSVASVANSAAMFNSLAAARAMGLTASNFSVPRQHHYYPFWSTGYTPMPFYPGYLFGYGGQQTLDPSMQLSNMIAGTPYNNNTYIDPSLIYGNNPPSQYGLYPDPGQFPQYNQYSQFDPNATNLSVNYPIANPALSGQDFNQSYGAVPELPSGAATTDSTDVAHDDLGFPAIAGAGYFGDALSHASALPDSDSVAMEAEADGGPAAPFSGTFWKLPNPGGILSTVYAHQNPAMEYFLAHRWDALHIALNHAAPVENLTDPALQSPVDSTAMVHSGAMPASDGDEHSPQN